MARQTVAFRVAAHARLEALAGRLTVPNQEELPRVMIPRPQHSCRDQSRARVTTGAERTDVVAIAARRLTGIRGGGMARPKPVRMIARPARGTRPVAFQAIGAYVAAGAAGRGCSRFRAVTVGKVGTVIRGRSSRHHRRRSGIRWEPCDRARWRRAGVALVAELPRVAGGTRGSDRLARDRPMTAAAEKVRRRVRGWRGEISHVAPTERHGTDQRHMAGCARGVGRCQMRGSDAVTIEAALDDRLTHSHARLADDRVTARAG